MTAALPTPRTFLTKLINSLPSNSALGDAQDVNSANPLKHIQEPEKQLFLTLHVLFPNELLPALDLLDRELVTRFIVRDNTIVHAAPEPEQASKGERHEPESAKPQDKREDRHPTHTASDDTTTVPDLGSLLAHPPPPASAQAAAPPTNTFYLVRSAQPPPAPHHRSHNRFPQPADTSAPAPHYEVRLRAWNCSCPAFAFAAFPAETAARSAALQGRKASFARTGAAGEVGLEGDAGEEEREWRFGGLMLGGGDAPVCKHLLACVLGERCGLLGRFVEERGVSGEEAAGWVALCGF